MYSQVPSPCTNITFNQYSHYVVRKNRAQQERSKRRIPWGCFSECSRLEPSKITVHSEIDGDSRQSHHTHKRLINKVTTVFPPASERQPAKLFRCTKLILFDVSWITEKWEKLLEVAYEKNCCWLRRYVAATMTVLVVQAITSQDVSYALSSTHIVSFGPRSMVDFHLSPWIQSVPLSCCPVRLDSLRYNAKYLSTGKSSLIRAVVWSGARVTTQNWHKGTQTRGQIQGAISKGLVYGVGGRAAATKASHTSLQALPLALVTGSLTSPLASILKAGSQVDLNVLRASFASSLNLISLCTFVVWMQRSGQLPAETPVILSQVAFRVLIPCFLMTKVAVTLASHPTANLLFLPLIAIAQVFVGALLGKVACRIVFGERPSVMPLTLKTTMQASPVPAAITTSVGGSSVITQLEKIPLISTDWKNSEQYMAAKKEAIITAACAFGNSFTLPLIFMTGVLAAEEASQVAGYLALFMVGWSPALWTVGYSIIATGDEDSDLEENVSKDRFSMRTLVEGCKRIMNPPLYGVLAGVFIGATPLSHLFLPVVKGSAITVESTALAVVCTTTAGILRPVFDAAALLGTATLAVQTIVLASSLAASLPPITTARHAKKASRVVEAVVDPLETTVSTNTEMAFRSAKLETVLDARAFWIISSVRLIAMPIIVIISTVILQCARILPVDPVYNLTLLAESAMPSAQNLVLLSQLRASTRRLSGMLADLLLRQYALSVFPITVWMALFLAIVKTA